MEKVFCDVCKKLFKRKLSQINYFEHHYCSKQCHYQARKLGIYTKCANCNKPIYKALKTVRDSQNKKFFCSIKCSNKIHGEIYSRASHPNWKGGEYSYREYMCKQKRKRVCILCKTTNKSVLVVHHLDKDRKNNNIKNLVWLCYNCHFLAHHHKEENNKLLKYAKS